jgi:DNA-binding MarR family transcriptional regulator
MPKAKQMRVVTLIALVRTLNVSMVDDLIARLNKAGYPDVTAAHHSVFENIDAAGTRLTTLAQRAGVTRQSITELVTALERQGYVELKADPADRRARLVHLTRRGRGLARAAVTHIAQIEAEWQECLERAGLNRPLRPLLELAITDHDNKPPSVQDESTAAS